MKAVLLCLVAFLIAASFADGIWVNKTLTQFAKEGNKYAFLIDYKNIPTGSDYFLEVTVNFLDYYDDFSVDLEGPKNEHVILVEKEKGLSKTFILQKDSLSFNGWIVDGLKCGALRGVVECSSPLASVKVNLGLSANSVSVSSQSFNRDCRIGGRRTDAWEGPHRFHSHAIGILLALAFFATALLCCCCVCRAVCARRRCKMAGKQLKEAYPSEAVIEAAIGTETYAPVATDDGQQFVVMVPVATESGQAHPSYVQLMPVMYPTQQ